MEPLTVAPVTGCLGDGLVTRHAHLQKFEVAKSDRVDAGQLQAATWVAGSSPAMTNLEGMRGEQLCVLRDAA